MAPVPWLDGCEYPWLDDLERGGAQTPPFQGAGFSGSGLTPGTCTGIGTLTASVDGRGFVAEMGAIRPFQPHSGKHFLSRAGSGRGVHRPYWIGTTLYPWAMGTGMQGPYWKSTFCTPRDEQGRRAGGGPAGVGVSPGQAPSGGLDGGNGGHGIWRSGRRWRWRRWPESWHGAGVSAMIAMTVTQGRCPTLTAPAAQGERGRQDGPGLLKPGHRTVAAGAKWGLRRRWRGALDSCLIVVLFPSDSCRSIAIDMGGTAPKPLRRACRGRILNALSGFSSVSPA